MPRITFVERNGAWYEIDAAIGMTVMEAAVRNGVPGILADCGGACVCATCHVYVADEWFGRVGPPDPIECDMLEAAEGVRENSRLSCQIPLTAALDGLVVGLPVEQHLA